MGVYQDIHKLDNNLESDLEDLLFDTYIRETIPEGSNDPGKSGKATQEVSSCVPSRSRSILPIERTG